MVAFGSPFRTVIHPKGWVRPAGNYEPVVTATFADHLAGGRNPGVDIGCGRCGDILIAQCDAIVSLAGLIGYPTPNALTIRYRSARHPDFEPAVTHMATLAVNPRTRAKWKPGDAIYRDEQVGTLGKSGADACHAHTGLKQLINGVWTEIDGWPFLEQNGATEDDVLQGANPKRIANRKTTVKADSTNFRSSPFVKADNVLDKFAASALCLPDWSVEGTAVTVGGVTSKLWYGFWGLIAAGKQEFGYMNALVLNALAPIEQSGHTDQELIDTARKAGHNAAVDVSAVGQKALVDAAAKYPAA
jgi:hypothetical protein